MPNFARIAFMAAAAALASAETHTIEFINQCGFGTPTLVENGVILSSGSEITINGPVSAIAYLQTGGCGLNGEGCTIVNINLQNPTTPGTGSCSIISSIPPHQFSVTTGFGYFNGCDGEGQDCLSANCPIPLVPNEQPQVCCQTDNVDIAITFCD